LSTEYSILLEIMELRIETIMKITHMDFFNYARIMCTLLCWYLPVSLFENCQILLYSMYNTSIILCTYRTLVYKLNRQTVQADQTEIVF